MSASWTTCNSGTSVSASTACIPAKRTNLTHSRPAKRRVTSRPRITTSAPLPATTPEVHQTDSQEPCTRIYDEESDDTLDHVIMAVDKTNQENVGCAYYVARDQLLCCVEDIERGGCEALEILKLDIRPTILLVSSRTEDIYPGGDSPKRQGSLVTDDGSRLPLPYDLIVRPATDFRYENAINKLMGVQSELDVDGIRFMVPGDNMNFDETKPLDEIGHTESTGAMLYVSGCLDLENNLSIGCAGAVLAYLQRRRASEFLHDDPASRLAYRVTQMEMTSLKNTMLVSADTLTSLQIIQPESHPNTAKQGPGSGGAKESLSVYGLFCHLSRTPQGKNRLRQIFLRPSLDIEVIQERQSFVAVFASSENQATSERLSKSLSKVKNMRAIMVNLQKGIDSKRGSPRSGVWTAILEFCFHAIDIADILNEIVGAENLPLCANLLECLDKTQFQRIGRMIHDNVDLDQSIEQRRTVIRRQINDDLDRVKDVYDGMDQTLWEVAREITNAMPPHVDVSLNVLFLPQLGFHIVVPMENGRPVYDGGWERRFTTETHAYFKNTRMREIDAQLGDLYAVICDTEIEIAYDLAQRVLHDEQLLVKASDMCGELDCLLALAHGAVQYKLTKPQIVQEPIINIREGRHILQEMTVPSFVPNDTIMNRSMILLTGPNFSGKSVYLKQVALIVYMAQVGSFVPAESAVIGIVDKILTRITTRETVSKVQSAFMTDLQQITLILSSCTKRSLVVIDEFGKGTDSCDGAGLAAAVLQYLLELTQPPRVLASTHFHEIFEMRRFEEYQNLDLAHMKVHVGTIGNEVVYLYVLRPGKSILSYGSQCAATSGVPSAVVERAMQLTQLAIQGEDLVVACAPLPPAELEDLERAEIVARTFLGENLDGDVRAMLAAI